MVLKDLVEMTMRIGSSIPFLDNYDLSSLNNTKVQFVGKMQHGYDIFVYEHDSTFIYLVKNDKDEVLTMTQITEITIPKIGKVFEVLNSKTDSRFSGNLLNYKLKYFLVHHLGYKLLAGKIHSESTENVLQKMPQYFDIYMVNVKTGNTIYWTYDKYLKLTSIGKVTDWQVLLASAHTPLKESMPNLPGMDVSRHAWTYNEQLFKDCI